MKKWFAFLLALAMCSGLVACTNSATSTTSSQTDKPSFQEQAQTQLEAIIEERDSLYDNDNSGFTYRDTGATMGERNALDSAEQYLNSMAFSYSGLIEQLEYEGYSNSEATYAADNCGADWYEQAALSAKEYLDAMSFSRQGLIEQLEYEGFTYGQAVYGVEQNGY